MKIQLALAALALAFSTACLSRTPFDEALVRAKADEAKPENKPWMASMDRDLGRPLAIAFKACMDEGVAKNNATVSLVMDIDPRGHVANIWLQSDSPYGRCAARHLKSWAFPAPGAEAYFSLVEQQPGSAAPAISANGR